MPSCTPKSSNFHISSVHWERRQLTWSDHKLAHKEPSRNGNALWQSGAILADMQAGRPALIKKDGGEMLIALVLD